MSNPGVIPDPVSLSDDLYWQEPALPEIIEEPGDERRLKLLLLIVVVILLLAGLGIGLYFLLREEPQTTAGCTCTIADAGCTCCDECQTITPDSCSLVTPPETLNGFPVTCKIVNVLGTDVLSYDFTNEFVGVHTYNDPSVKWFLNYTYDGFYTYFALEAVSEDYNPTAWTLADDELAAVRYYNGSEVIVGVQRGTTAALPIGSSYGFPFGSFDQVNYNNENDLYGVTYKCVFDGYNFFFYSNYNVFILRAGRNNPNQYIWFDFQVCPVTWIGDPALARRERTSGGLVPDDSIFFYLTVM